MDSSVGPVTKQVLLPEVIIINNISQKLCAPIKCTLQAKIWLMMKRFSIARSQAQKMFEAQTLSLSTSWSTFCVTIMLCSMLVTLNYLRFVFSFKVTYPYQISHSHLYIILLRGMKLQFMQSLIYFFLRLTKECSNIKQYMYMQQHGHPPFTTTKRPDGD